MKESRAVRDDSLHTPSHPTNGVLADSGEPGAHRRLAGKRIIDEQARRQVRTFLDEVKNGTQDLV